MSDDRVKVFTAGAFAENGYVVRDEGAGCAIVVDPGACADQQVEWLRQTGDRLDAIVLTHAHLDHVEGIPVVRRAFYCTPPTGRSTTGSPPRRPCSESISKLSRVRPANSWRTIPCGAVSSPSRCVAPPVTLRGT